MGIEKAEASIDTSTFIQIIYLGGRFAYSYLLGADFCTMFIQLSCEELQYLFHPKVLQHTERKH